MSDEDVKIEIGASTEGLEEGASEAKEAIAEFVERIKEFGERAQEASEKADEHFKEFGEHAKETADELKEHFLELAEVVGIAFTVDALKELIEQNAELGEQMERTAAMLGVAGSQASELSGMAKLTGTSFEGLEHAVERMDLQLASLDSKSSHAAEALRVLGINSKQFASASTVGQLNQLAEAFSRFADGPTKTAAAMALLGRAGAEMIPYLDRGKEGLEELNTTLDRTGAIMSDQMVEAFAHTNEDINTMKLAWHGVSQEIFDVFNPAIDAAVKGVTGLLEKVKEDDIRSWAVRGAEAVSAMYLQFVEAGEKIKAVMADVEAFGSRLEHVIDNLAAPFIKLAGAIKTATGALREFMDTHLGVDPAFIPHPGAGGAAATGAGAGAPASPYGAMPQSGDFDVSLGQQIKANALAAARNIKTATDEAKKTSDTIAHMFDKPKEVLGGAEGGKTKPSVPQMQIGGGGANKDTAAKDAEEEAQTEIKLFTDLTNQKEKLLDEQLKTHQISTEQWLAQTKDALQDELQDTTDAYQREAQTAGLTDQQIKAIKDKIALADAANAEKVQQAEIKAAEEATKAWDSAMSSINSAFDSQIDKLLRGTETWHTAFKNVLADLTEQLIKFGVNKALTGVESIGKSMLGVGKVGADATKDVALATNTGAMTALTASLNALTIAMGGQIPALAANTAATGVSAVSADANTVSTDANTVASNFQAAMQQIGNALKAALPFFAEGTPFVASTGLAVLHQGEAVIPAEHNPFANGGAGWSIPSDVMESMRGGGGGGALASAQSAGAGFRSLIEGGGGNGGDTYHTHNWGGVSVNHYGNGKLDPAEVAAAIDAAVRGGSHTGLKAFRR